LFVFNKIVFVESINLQEDKIKLSPLEINSYRYLGILLDITLNFNLAFADGSCVLAENVHYTVNSRNNPALLMITFMSLI